MKNRSLGRLGFCMVTTLLLSQAGGVASAVQAGPMQPEVAAKAENHRKQTEQRVTDEKRKTAVDALKAERLKVYNARQQVKKSKKGVHDVKDLSNQ